MLEECLGKGNSCFDREWFEWFVEEVKLILLKIFFI